MALSEADFRKLGYRAVDMAAEYLAGLAERPVYRRMEETERGALMEASRTLPAPPDLTPLRGAGLKPPSFTPLPSSTSLLRVPRAKSES